MRKFLQNAPFARFIILSYAALLIILVAARIFEYKNMRQTKTALNELISKTIHRQSTINLMLKSSNYIQINVLNLLYNPDKREKEDSEKIAILETKKNDSNLAEYQKMINGEEEQQLFNKLKLLQKVNRENREKVFQLMKSGKYDEAINIYKNLLSHSYEDYQNANTVLADFVSSRDIMQTKKAESQLSKIENVNNWINASIIISLITLGLILLRTVRIIRNTNLELKESENKYRTLTEQTNEIIEKCDVNGKFVFANDSFKKRLEYSDDELSNLTISDILAEGSINLNKQDPKLAKIITNVEKVFKSKSGKKIYLEGNVLLEYKNGNFTGSMGFFNDVTEKKQLEESLIASEGKFRNFFDLAPIPMWAFNPETYRFVLVNKAAIEHYGYTEEEFLNMTIMDLRHEKNILKVKEEILQMKEEINNSTQQNKVYRYSLEHFKKSREIMEVEVYNTPIILNDKKDILSTAIDVTERNQYENKITKAIIKTQEDERYEIGSELHDNVCQILAAAKMSLGMLKPFLIPSVTGLYNQSRESIILATDEIRNLSHRLAPAFFNNTKLEEAFESLLKTFNIEDKHSISMYFDNAAKKYPINREIQLNMYRILQEQLRNIIKYANATAIEVDVLIHNDKLKMRIADNGIGFNVNEVKSGIGLANMKRRSELFSGKIQIDSSPGNGCEILITIPLFESN